MNKYDAGDTWHFSSPFFWHRLHHHILYTYLSGYLHGAPREYVRHGLVLGSDRTSCQLSSTCIILVCLGPPSILLFVQPLHVSHMHPPLPIGQLNTSVQVNNMALLHLIYNSQTYLHHIHITIHSLLHTSTLLGRPAGLDPSCREQGASMYYSYVLRYLPLSYHFLHVTVLLGCTVLYCLICLIDLNSVSGRCFRYLLQWLLVRLLLL
jgi:hypothetical protein